MYRHEILPFGSFELHRFISGDDLQHFTVAPGKGGCLLELVFRGVDVIEGYDSPEALDANSGANSMPLFPFPNRLEGGTYEWGGNTYRLPLNDRSGPNAIHGFSRQVGMEITNTQLREHSAAITCTYRYRGEREGYPFPFTFDLTYQLEDGGRFRCTMSCANTGDRPLPFGFGWHPYFRPADRVEEMRLQLPPVERVEVNGQMIPTGRRSAFDRFAESWPVGDLQLDTCFALVDPAPRAEVLLEGENGRLRYWQETGPGKFNFLQVFTPAGRRSLAIEPMTCNINAFRNGEGLIKLEPEERAQATFGVEFLS